MQSMHGMLGEKYLGTQHQINILLRFRTECFHLGGYKTIGVKSAQKSHSMLHAIKITIKREHGCLLLSRRKTLLLVGIIFERMKKEGTIKIEKGLYAKRGTAEDILLTILFLAKFVPKMQMYAKFRGIMTFLAGKTISCGWLAITSLISQKILYCHTTSGIPWGSKMMTNNFREDEFWKIIPLWKEIDYETFIDHRWQEKNAVSSFKKLIKIISDVADPSFLEDAQKGFAQAPMAVRISPYLLSLMDWDDPINCPIRRQFLPLASQLLPDHPMLKFDSLAEQEDAPVKGLTHRYPDKVLFLALDTCPVYCRFCTRSYAVGTNTPTNEKVSIKASRDRWKDVFKYLRDNKSIEDVVISGGDSYRLKADQIYEIGD